MYFMDYLCENYGKDDEITSVLDTTRLLFIPTMNPDGFDSHRRENSKYALMLVVYSLKGVLYSIPSCNFHSVRDLNRDFPDQYVKTSTPESAQKETKAIMDLSSQYPCQVLRVALHCRKK